MTGRVLVTGAGGLVGRAVVKALQAAGVSVIAVGRNPPLTAAENLTIDLTGSESLLTAVAEPPDALVHLAAAVPHWPRYPDDDNSAAATRAIDATVFSAARVWGARIIYASSCGLYDPVDPRWKTESSPVVARSPYFSAKLHGETVALDHGAAVLRLSAPCGPGMSPSLVLPRFIRAASNGGVIEVWGSGKREQDFISSADVGAAILATLQTSFAGIINIASGAPMPTADLAELIVRVIGRGTVKRKTHPDPQEGWTARYRIDKAARDLGWRPQRALAEDVIDLAREPAA